MTTGVQAGNTAKRAAGKGGATSGTSLNAVQLAGIAQDSAIAFAKLI